MSHRRYDARRRSPCWTYLAAPSPFLVTDIESSTALWERARQAMAAAIERHLRFCRADDRGPWRCAVQDRG